MDYYRTIAQNTRCDVRKCLLGVRVMADNILGFKCSTKNRPKWPSISTFQRLRTVSRRMTSQKTDVINLFRSSLAVIGGVACTIYSILGITAAVYFLVTKHHFGYGNSVLASVYSICTLYRVSQKMIPCAV